jgi:hypothetical protein
MTEDHSRGDDRDAHRCGACKGLARWCRGCGGADKLKHVPDEMYELQFGSCGETVPCFRCDPAGRSLRADDPLFWWRAFWRLSRSTDPRDRATVRLLAGALRLPVPIEN